MGFFLFAVLLRLRQPPLLLLEAAWVAAADHSAIAKFAWDAPHTWGSSWAFLCSSVVAYLVLVFCLDRFLSDRKSALPLGYLPAVHNLNLLVLSLVIFLGCLRATLVEMGSASWLWGGSRGWEWVFCFPLGTRPAGRVFFWSYAFYLSKYYEFLDTLILVLKRKPLTFLHVFHHSIVVVMSFFWLEYAQSLQVIALLTNTAVHMLMYSYYLLCSLGVRPPWKRLVTDSQIFQFIVSFILSIVLLWFHFTGDGCAGMGAWAFNAFFNTALLLLFVNFHRHQYRSRTGKDKSC